jgi:hypothetical protein
MIHWKLATLIAYLEKITPYGGILIIWTDSWNFIIADLWLCRISRNWIN